MGTAQVPPTIACDESGSEGENLVNAAHPVFTHGSVVLDWDDAERILGDLRDRAPSKAPEYKAEHLLRSRFAGDLEWFMGDDGVAGRASAYLVDKHYFVVSKVIDLIVEELAHERGVDLYSGGHARAIAMGLAEVGPRALGNDWPPILAAFNSLARARQRRGIKATVEDFFSIIDSTRRSHNETLVNGILDLIMLGRSHAEALAAGLQGNVRRPPALDPLFAALPQTVRTWHERLGEPIRVVHDKQAALTPPRVEAMLAELRNPFPEFAFIAPQTSIIELTQVDSREDPRVQIADIVAGVARVIAQDTLAGQLKSRAELLRPIVDPRSLWCDEESWARLRPNKG